MNQNTTALSRFIISLKLAKNQKDAQRVLLLIAIAIVAIAGILGIFLDNKKYNPPVPADQLQQSILQMKETSVPIRQRP